MPAPHLIPQAVSELERGIAKRCPCGDHLGHELVEVRWFNLSIGEICIKCGAVDCEWVDGVECAKPSNLTAN